MTTAFLYVPHVMDLGFNLPVNTSEACFFTFNEFSIKRSPVLKALHFRKLKGARHDKHYFNTAQYKLSNIVCRMQQHVSSKRNIIHFRSLLPSANDLFSFNRTMSNRRNSSLLQEALIGIFRIK